MTSRDLPESMSRRGARFLPFVETENMVFGLYLFFVSELSDAVIDNDIPGVPYA